jgi:tRNA threonylcarbamoyladenosine biosynthesis protein TsaE
MARVDGDAADTRRTTSPEDTEALGAALAPALATGDLLLLVGPLGAGKTRFVVGLAWGLGARGRVRSPSFTLVNEYAGGRVMLYHLDLYRLAPSETRDLGLEELRERGALVVEWGDRLPANERSDALELSFAVEGEWQRAIAARGHGARGRELLERWRDVGPGRGA